MNTLFQYLCPSCGSHLTTNDERKVMVCKACGNVYDYDYFREDMLLDMADLSRKKGEYASAAEMYSFMLEKEPGNWHALNGLMLCDAGINALSDVPSLLRKGSFSTKFTDFEKYRSSCAPEHMEYFDMAEKIISMGRQYVVLGQKSETKKSETRRLQSRITGNNNKARSHYIRNKSGGYTHPLSLLIASIVGMVLTVGACIAIALTNPEYIGYSLLFFLLFGVFIGYLSHELKAVNDATKSNDDINAQIDQVIEEKKAIDEQQESTIREINNLIKEIRKLTPADN